MDLVLSLIIFPGNSLRNQNGWSAYLWILGIHSPFGRTANHENGALLRDQAAVWNLEIQASAKDPNSGHLWHEAVNGLCTPYPYRSCFKLHPKFSTG